MMYDFSPLYRSTIGFDRIVDMLNKAAGVETGNNWPPYDIERTGDDQYRITMALAGFSPQEIELLQQEGTLIITGQKASEPEDARFLHRGIAGRSFKQTFRLAEHVKAAGANMADGLLTIDLVREIPEALKPRRIEIGSGNEHQAVNRDKIQQIERGKAA